MRKSNPTEYSRSRSGRVIEAAKFAGGIVGYAVDEIE